MKSILEPPFVAALRSCFLGNHARGVGCSEDAFAGVSFDFTILFAEASRALEVLAGLGVQIGDRQILPCPLFGALATAQTPFVGCLVREVEEKGAREYSIKEIDDCTMEGSVPG